MKHRMHKAWAAGSLAIAMAPGAAQGQEQALATVEVTETRLDHGGTLSLDEPNGTGSRLGLTARETPASVSAQIGRASCRERV